MRQGRSFSERREKRDRRHSDQSRRREIRCPIPVPDSRPMSRRLPRPILSMRTSDRKVSASVSASSRAWPGALPGFTTVASPRSPRGGSSRGPFPSDTRRAGPLQVKGTDFAEILRPIRSDTCVACGGGASEGRSRSPPEVTRVYRTGPLLVRDVCGPRCRAESLMKRSNRKRQHPEDVFAELRQAQPT